MTKAAVDQTTFRQAFGVLQHHAETLRDQEEPNICLLYTSNQRVAQGVNNSFGG